MKAPLEPRCQGVKADDPSAPCPESVSSPQRKYHDHACLLRARAARRRTAAERANNARHVRNWRSRHSELLRMRRVYDTVATKLVRAVLKGITDVSDGQAIVRPVLLHSRLKCLVPSLLATGSKSTQVFVGTCGTDLHVLLIPEATSEQAEHFFETFMNGVAWQFPADPDPPAGELTVYRAKVLTGNLRGFWFYYLLVPSARLVKVRPTHLSTAGASRLT